MSEEKTKEQVSQEEKRQLEEHIKSLAPGVDTSGLNVAQLMELVGQYSKASVLYFNKVNNLSKEEKQVYEQLLLKTNPNVDIEERFKLADQLFNAIKAEEASKEPSKEATEGKPEEKKPAPKAQVETKETKSNIGEGAGGSNLISDVNEAPLGTPEEVFAWREKRWKAHMNYVTKQ